MNLKQVTLATNLYLDRAGALPADLEIDFASRLYRSGDVTDERLFRCRQAKKDGVPALLRVPAPGATGGILEIDYLFNPVLAGKTQAELDSIQAPEQFPVCWEGKPFHDKGKTRCVGFLDGSVRLMPEAEFQAMRRRP